MAEQKQLHPIEQELAEWENIERSSSSLLRSVDPSSFERRQLKFLHGLAEKYKHPKSAEEKHWVENIHLRMGTINNKLHGNVLKELKTIFAERKEQQQIKKAFRDLAVKPTPMQRLSRIYGRIFPERLTSKIKEVANQTLLGLKYNKETVKQKLNIGARKDQKMIGSYEQLEQLLKDKGYANAIDDFKMALVNKETNFSVRLAKVLGSEPVMQELNFSVTNNKITWHSVDTKLRDENKPGQIKTLSLPVDGSRTFSSMEAIRLAKGEAVCRLEQIDHKGVEKVLYKVNGFDLAQNNAEKELKRYVGRPFDMMRSMDALPFAERLTNEDKAKIVDRLVSGQNIPVMLKHDKISMKVNLSVGPDGGLQVTDLRNRPISASQIQKHLDISQRKSQQSETQNVGKSKGIKAA